MKASVRRILLVEPGYRNKYPPLGLMKISTYHQLRGDYVEFVKGCSAAHRSYQWDRVYVATLFSFYWRETLRTISYYARCVAKKSDIWVGGVLASLMGQEILEATGATVVAGLMDQPGILDCDNRYIVDHLIPDYGILDDIDYQYPAQNAYFGYATRGCPNHCRFCAVPILEPHFQDYSPLVRQIRGIEDLFGTKRDLLLLDNNVLASKRYERIIKDIIFLGFEKGATYNNQARSIDFNQGLDSRLITPKNVALLAKTAINPMRLAFDSMGMSNTYQNAIRLACDCGIREISTYVLFNYLDTPKSFYDRLRLSAELNTSIGSKIMSFPMRYVPVTDKDRRHIGPHWNKRLLRGIQCILLATRGLVSPRLEFFEAAFGKNIDEFTRIASMPEHYIIYRQSHHNNGACDWNKNFQRLTTGQKTQLYEILNRGKVTTDGITNASGKRLRAVLEHYVDEAEKAHNP